MSNSISGNLVVPGVVVTAQGTPASLGGTGALVKSSPSDATGNYSITGLANDTYTVYPDSSGWFSPGSQLVTISGSNVSGINFVAAPLTSAGIKGLIIFDPYLFSQAIKVLPPLVNPAADANTVGFGLNNKTKALGRITNVVPTSYTLTGVSVAAGVATYTGNFGPDADSNGLVGNAYDISGFSNSGNNSSTPIFVTASTTSSISCTATTQVNETHAAQALAHPQFNLDGTYANAVIRFLLDPNRGSQSVYLI